MDQYVSPEVTGERKLKVLHVNDLWPVTGDLVSGLQSLGVEAEIFEPTVGGYRASRFRRVVLPLIRTLEAFQLRQLVQKRQFDVVHVHYARFAYMPLLTGLPYILHCHGSDLRLDLFRPGLRELTLAAIRQARKVLYVTPELYRFLKDIRNDAIFLPNPLDMDRFAPEVGDQAPSPRVLCISKLDAFKGVDNIIRAIELVWDVRPQTQIALFDFGNSYHLAKRFIEQHRHESRLILLPRVPHNEMPALIRSYAVVLGHQSPEFGALSLSELESMACGRPVVCCYNYPEAYPEPPPLLVSRTLEEASAQILQFLDDSSLCQDLGRKARAWVSKYHELGQVARMLLEVYHH